MVTIVYIETLQNNVAQAYHVWMLYLSLCVFDYKIYHNVQRESLDKDRVTTPLSSLVALGLFLTSGAIYIAGAPLLTVQRRNICTVWLHVEEQHENNLSRFPKIQEVAITC